jgi:hypothetical protein
LHYRALHFQHSMPSGFIALVIIAFRKKDGGIAVVAKKASRNQNVFLTTAITRQGERHT